MKEYVRGKVVGWVSEIDCLSRIAMSQPQAAYATLTHGLTAKWTFIIRTIPDIEDEMQPLEDAIRYSFLPALTGRQAFSDTD